MTSNLIQPAAEIPAGKHSTQTHGGRCPWVERTRDDLLTVLASESPPQFRTVLASNQFNADGKVTHSTGPMYADFDGAIYETIADFKSFLVKLQGLDVDLAQVRLFATGGRGFHCEIPMACFMTSSPSGGIADLHRIYREMALALLVDTMDCRVYTNRRMWRVPNVRRDNGLFKVPLTPTEAMIMTPESYANLCSTPRPFPELAPATLAPGLARLYEEASRKHVVAQVRKRTTSKQGEAFKQRFANRGAALPPSLQALAAGRVPVREGVGFNSVALQLCVTAQALDVTEGQLITLARGLIDKHRGDGDRYNTPSKRERELREMFRFAEKSGYDVSIGGIRSILPAGFRCTDFRGLQ